MKDEKWADLMSNLMRIAEDLFSSVKDFKKGKLVAEVEAEVNVRIEIAKDRDGRINAGLTILPLKKEEDEMGEFETSEPRKTEEDKPKIESLKTDIEVLDVDENLDYKEQGGSF